MNKDAVIRVALFEDNPGDIHILRNMLGKVLGEGFEIEYFQRLADGIAHLREHGADIALLDLGLPDSHGPETFRTLHAELPHIPTVVLTGLSDEEVAVSTIRAGGQDYLIKGQFDARALARTIRYAIERKRAELLLQQREGEYRALVERAPNLISRFDRAHHFVFANPAAERDLGIAPEALNGRTAGEAGLPGELDATLAAAIDRVFTTWSEETAELGFPRPNGRRHFLVRLVPEDAQRVGEKSILAVWSDVTLLKTMESELRRAKDEAEAASRAKSEFLANMSHEIRTPMNGVLGMTELALMSDPPPRIVDYLRLANQSARSLLTIINDILDLSKVEAGRMELERTELDLREIMDSTLRPLALSAERKGLFFHFLVDPAVPAALHGDPGRLRQVLANLAGNAVKFTREGAVSVLAAPESPEEPCRVRFTIRDTGIGIAPDKLGAIFESFTQAGTSSHAEFGGTGLGLAISRAIVRLMGGDIEVSSEPGRGSVFTFTLSLCPPGSD